jgi:hypothetical protein
MEIAIYQYCNPYLNDKNERTFILDGKSITIYQNKAEGISFTLWDCV